jgi:hypothetical protein
MKLACELCDRHHHTYESVAKPCDILNRQQPD